MDKVACRYDATSGHSQDQGTDYTYRSSLRVHDDLLSRIRSLLASRNDQSPSKTPLPTPDYTLISPGVEENVWSSSLTVPSYFDLRIAKTVIYPPDGVEERRVRGDQFGKPAELSETSGTDSATHDSVRLDLEQGRSVTLNPKDMAVVNQGFLANTLGRGRRKPNDSAVATNANGSVPTKPQSHHEVQDPRSVLRTVLPDDHRLTEARLRPSVQHVPGSYKSEINYSVDSEKPDPIQSSAIVDLPNDDGPWWSVAAATYAEPRSETTKPGFATRELIAPITTPSRKSSLRSTGSAASVRLQRQHGLARSSAEPLISNEQLPPPDSFSLDHADDHNEEQSLLQPLANISKAVEKEQPKLPVEKQSTSPVSALAVTPDGPQLSELLARLPPLKPEVIAGFKGHHLTATVERNSPRAPLNPNSVLEHESERPSRNNNPGGLARQPPQSAKNQLGDSRDPLSHSRAACLLSSTSSDSTVRMVHSQYTVRNMSDDSHDEATHLIQPPPLFVTDDRVPPGRANNEASLAEESEFPQQFHGAADSEDSEGAETIHVQPHNPDRKWIHQLLRRASDKPYPQEPPNLTARPFYRPRRTFTQHVDRDNTGFLPLREDEVPSNNGGSLQVGESNKAQSTVGEGGDKQTTTESFSKVILDLETLLDEAVSVAKDAADRNDTDALPAILEEASRVLKNEARGFGKDRSEGSSSSDPDSPSRYGIGSESHGQPRDHVVIIEPDDDDLHSGHFKRVRDNTPYPSSPAPASRQPSVVPEDGSSQAIPLKSLASVHFESSTQEQLPALAHDGSRGRSPYFEILQNPRGQEVGTAPGSTRTIMRIPNPLPASEQTDWAYVHNQRQPRDTLQVPQALTSTVPTSVIVPGREGTEHVIREDRPLANVPSSDEVQDYIALHHQPPITPRRSSAGLRSGAFPGDDYPPSASASKIRPEDHDDGDQFGDRSQSARRGSVMPYQQRSRSGTYMQSGSAQWDAVTFQPLPEPHRQQTSLGQEMTTRQHGHHRRHRRHRSSSGHHSLGLGGSHRHSQIARDWETPRKRWVAAIACINTALLGLIVGIYAGEVPAIQYTLADEHHYTILGNVFLYIGLAIPTILFWPLPLLHGRKPYTLVALALLLPLQFPQAIVLNAPRSPNLASYRVGLLLSRALSGVAMGFANVNFKMTLLDLFGASLQSANPHQELVNEHDVRRHGGGMGIWLGIWTWCFMGSIGVGFLIGALVISRLNVVWGFYITIEVIALVLFLNVLTPEVRRSAHRRSVAEVRTATEIARRVARGEVMMHLTSRGPTWWWEEVFAGQVLCARMLKQPGFVVLALYLGWIYGQIVMLIVLLGALISRYYRFRPQHVGLCVFAIPLGALLAIPFQKASLFSRSRRHPPRTDSMTFQKRVVWTSHLLRRIIFMIALPFADLAYTLASSGPPVHFIVPTIFAGLIGFLSNLAIAECNGLVMETYDTSDLQPGMIGRPRSESLPDSVKKKRTSYTCYPRVVAGFSISQAFAFLIAAAATGAGGAIERKLGARTATGVVAGVLLVLTVLLIGVLWRWKEVQVVPTDRFGTGLSLSGDEPWRPVIIGNPSGRTRKLSLLELGRLSRWSEIRRKNKLTGLG